MIAAFFIAQLVALLAGTLLLLALGGRRLPLGLFLSAAWLAGTGALAAERLLLAQAGLPWSTLTLALPWLAVAFIAAWRLRREGWRPPPRLPLSRQGRLGLAADIAVALVIAVWVAALWWQATNQPLAGWDAWSMWFFKGRAMFMEGTVPISLFTDVRHYDYYAHLDYPLLVPLTITQTYAWTGDYDPLMKGWWPLLAGAAALGMYWGLHGLMGRAARFGGLLLVLGAPDLINYAAGYYAGYAELPLAVLSLFGAIFFYRWLKCPTAADFTLAALFFSLAGFTKNEGLVVAAAGLLLLFGIAVATRRLQWAASIGALAAVALFLLPWQVERSLLGLTADVQPSWDKIQAQWGVRINPVLNGLIEIATRPNRLYLIWPALPLLAGGALAFTPRRWLATLPLVLLVAAQLAAGVIAYIVTPRDLDWHLRTAADRVIFQPSLIVLFLGAIYLGLLLDRRDAAYG